MLKALILDKIMVFCRKRIQRFLHAVRRKYQFSEIICFFNSFSVGVTVGLFEMGVSHLENSPWAPPKASKNPPRDPPHYGDEPLKI